MLKGVNPTVHRDVNTAFRDDNRLRVFVFTTRMTHRLKDIG